MRYANSEWKQCKYMFLQSQFPLFLFSGLCISSISCGKFVLFSLSLRYSMSVNAWQAYTAILHFNVRLVPFTPLVHLFVIV